MNAMTGVVDLRLVSPQYDFITSLVSLECERLRRGASGLDLIVYLGGRNGGFKKGASWPQTREECEAAYAGIARPAMRLLPSITRVREISRDISARKRFGRFYGFNTRLHGLANQLALYRNPDHRCLVVPDPEPRDERLITLTLRESRHWPERNSDLGVWTEAARRLREAGWRAVVVRDTDRAHEPLAGLETAPEASFDLIVRARLYASARLNLFVNTGPAQLAVWLGAPLAIFKTISETHPASTSAVMARNGWEPGTQPEGWLPTQRHAWRPETAEDITAVVREMTERNCRSEPV